MTRGFTLIEVVIYIGILGIVLFFASGFVFNGITNSSKIQAWQDVNDNSRFITTKILESVQSSQGINGIQ